MTRRDFLQHASTAAASALAVATPLGAAAQSSGAGAKPATQPPGAAGARVKPVKRQFKLKYAPHFGMFKESAGEDLLDQLRFMADAGFTAFEDNSLMKRPPEVQQQIGDLLAKQGMTMGVFVIDAGDNWKVSYTTGKKELTDAFVKTCREALDTARRVNAKWMTIVPGYFETKLPMGIQTGHVIDTIRAGADVFAPHNLTMVMEPLSDNPDLFLRTSDQAYAIARAVNSPACKILYDIYHMQRNEGFLTSHIDLAWDEIGYFQIGDVPGRKEPTSGEINYKNLLKHIHEKMVADKRDFVFGMEHGNFAPGAAGELKVIEAYVETDSF